MYSINGVIITRITDQIIENNVTLRKSGNIELYIKNNKTILSKKVISLYPLEKSSDQYLFIPNPNIGVIDLDPNFDSDSLVLKLINDILRQKYIKTQIKIQCKFLPKILT